MFRQTIQLPLGVKTWQSMVTGASSLPSTVCATQNTTFNQSIIPINQIKSESLDIM